MEVRQSAWIRVILFCLISCVGLVASTAQAQETATRIFITGSDVGSPPSIELHVFGFDDLGNPLSLTNESLIIEHDGVPVSPIDVSGTYEAGTLTVFLIDIPGGVSEQFSAIQEAITQFASPTHMVEQVDAVAIYQVGETAAVEVLPPTTFYNSVQNFFTDPLTPATGATALIDSTMGLLSIIDSLKPQADMVASLVVISDGTDAVSTQFQAADVPFQATSLGVPIHTVSLINKELSAAGQELGQNYLADVAAGSWGISTSMDDSAELSTIWSQIGRFRNQARVRYTVEGLTGGTFPIRVSLAGDLANQAETIVTVQENSPSIVINLSPDSRTLSLPALDQPTRLRFNTTLTWLDGVERELQAAQLLVNGAVVQDITPRNVDDFDAEISNFVYGSNSVQVAVLDDQEMLVTSPTVFLTVNEGNENIPAELTAGGGSLLGRLLLFLVVLAVLVGLGFFVWQQGWLSGVQLALPRGRSSRSFGSQTPPDALPPGDGPDYPPDAYAPDAIAYLEVLESLSPMPAALPLSTTEVRIGRSPAMSDIALEKDVTVSRLHATLVLEGNHYRIYDERSTSGTWVNEQEVPEYGTQLIDGDEIHLGAVHLRFRQP